MSSIREQIAAWKPLPDPEQYSDMGRLGWQGFWIHQRDALEARLATATEALREIVAAADARAAYPWPALADARAVLDALDAADG